MITANRLNVFLDFQVDPTLPKHRSAANTANMEALNSVVQTQRRLRVRLANTVDDDFPGPPSLEVVDWRELVPSLSPDASWYHRLWRKLLLWLAPSPSFRRTNQDGPMSVEAFFTQAIDHLRDLDMSVVGERIVGYELAIRDAHRAGLTAYAETLETTLAAVRAETLLQGLGLTKYLDEADIVDLVRQSKRGLRLDYVRHFKRAIPSEIVDRKLACDRAMIFDNYVVLHYDPQGVHTGQTKAEVAAAKRDPILFGLLEGRTRLYFLGDWKDEYCDLTLDQVAEILGRGPQVLDPNKFN